MTSLIYVLRLHGGYYYVGRTSDLAARYEEHLEGRGSTWTTLHRPVTIERTLPETSPFDEDKTTKELMARYGIDRVRGGSYCQEHLSAIQVAALQAELRTATGSCFACGKPGHYAAECLTTAPGHSVTGTRHVHRHIIYDDDSDDDSFYSDSDSDSDSYDDDDSE